MSCFTKDISSRFPTYPIGMSLTLQKCFGSDNNPDLTVDYWATGQCPSAIHNYLYPTLDIDINNFYNLQAAAGKLIADYYKTPLNSPSNDGHPIETIIADLCSSRSVEGVEGICSQVLSQLCNGCSRDQIANNVPYLRLCGCFAPPLAGTETKVSTECDSLCNKPQFVSGIRSETAPYNPITCNIQRVCVITDVNFIANDNEVDGSFNLDQRCTGCTADSPCECVIDSTLPDQIRRLGFNDKVNFRNYCNNAASTCVVRDPATGNTMNVDCETQLFDLNPTFNSSATTNNDGTFLKINLHFLGAILFGLFIACIGAIALMKS